MPEKGIGSLLRARDQPQMLESCADVSDFIKRLIKDL